MLHQNPEPFAYSIPEAMEALRISRATIYQLINDQRLRTYQIGRRRFCSRDALIECQRELERAGASVSLGR